MRHITRPEDRKPGHFKVGDRVCFLAHEPFPHCRYARVQLIQAEVLTIQPETEGMVYVDNGVKKLFFHCTDFCDIGVKSGEVFLAQEFLPAIDDIVQHPEGSR